MGLLTGKNNKLSGLIKTVGDKIQTKLKENNIDEKKLEEEAKSMMDITVE